MYREQETRGPHILTEEEKKQFEGITINEAGEREEEPRRSSSSFEAETPFTMPRVKVFSLSKISWKVKLVLLLVFLGLIIKLGFFVTIFLFLGIFILGLVIIGYIIRRLFM